MADLANPSPPRRRLQTPIYPQSGRRVKRRREKVTTTKTSHSSSPPRTAAPPPSPAFSTPPPPQSPFPPTPKNTVPEYLPAAYNEDRAALVRNALRSRDRDSIEDKWVCYYSEVVKEEEVSSSSAVGPPGRAGFQRVSLKLDYEEIMNAWSNKGPLYVDNSQIVPDMNQHDFLSQELTNIHEQDYVFVRAFVPFVASVLLNAWKESSSDGDIEVLLGGLAALKDEIAWFKTEASKWGVVLEAVVPQEVNLDYCSFLERLMGPDVDYTQAMVAFWAIETVYQESFSHCLEEGSKTPEDLKETCERWRNDGFGQYCFALKSIAERLLEKASDDIKAKAEASFSRVLEYEVGFWNMSRGDI